MHERGEQERQQQRERIRQRSNMRDERNHVDLDLIHDKSMEQHAERHSGQRPEQRQDPVLPENVGSGLPAVEAEDFDRGDLPHPLRDVDSRQLIEDDEGEKPRADDDEQDDVEILTRESLSM